MFLAFKSTHVLARVWIQTFRWGLVLSLTHWVFHTPRFIPHTVAPMTLKKWLIFSRDQHSKKTLSPDEIKMQKARLKYSSQAGSLLLCSGQRWRQAVGGKSISAVPYVTPSCPQTTYLFQMSLKVTTLEHIWTSQHLLCPWPVIFRAARFSLICWKRAHSWVHRTQSWEVAAALSSQQWRGRSGIHKNVNKKLHISLQMPHESLPRHFIQRLPAANSAVWLVSTITALVSY